MINVIPDKTRRNVTTFTTKVMSTWDDKGMIVDMALANYREKVVIVTVIEQE